MSELKRLSQYFKPYKKEVIISLITLFITAFAILLFGKIARFFIDFGIKDSSNLSGFLVLFIFLVIILSFAGYLRSLSVNSSCIKVTTDLKKDIFKNLLNLELNFYNENKIGDIISRISSDLDNIYSILSGNFAFFIRNFILFFGGLLFLFITNIKLSLITISLIFLALLPIIFFSKTIKKLTKNSKESSSSLISMIEESLNAIKTIKSMLIEDKIYENFFLLNKESLKINLSRSRLKSLLIAITIFFSFLSISIVLYVGAKDVQNLTISAGELSAFIFYAVITSISLVGLSQIYSQIQSLKSSLDRIFFLIDTKPQIVEKPDSIKNISDISHLKLNNLNFSYSDNKEKILFNNLNLEITNNQKILISGESGSGKTTFFNLLLRFFEAKDNQILINDHDIKDYDIKALRSCFSYASQENFVFSGTILENIQIVDENLTKEQIQKIIDFYPSFSFINDLENGLNTQIGQKGSKLSGGQRQRISILRSILKPSKIILLDEPTSSLDEKNESDLYQFIKDYSKQKILIIISHQKPENIEFDQEVRV